MNSGGAHCNHFHAHSLAKVSAVLWHRNDSAARAAIIIVITQHPSLSLTRPPPTYTWTCIYLHKLLRAHSLLHCDPLKRRCTRVIKCAPLSKYYHLRTQYVHLSLCSARGIHPPTTHISVPTSMCRRVHACKLHV